MSDKKNRKGFIRVFEVILFTFLLYGILMPSFFKYNDFNDWNSAKNLILSHDLLYGLEKTRVLDDALISDQWTDGYNISTGHARDIDKLNNITEKVFPVNYDFEYEIKNVAPYHLSIGCVCSAAEMAWLRENILTISPPTDSYSIKPITLDQMSTDLNVIVIFGQQGLEAYRSNITHILKEGKGFVLIGNISDPDDMTKELFGLNYTGGADADVEMHFSNLSDPINSGISKRYVSNLIRVGTKGAGNTGKLYLKDDEYNISQDIANDCVNISSCSGCLRENETCTIPDVANITLYMIDPLANLWADILISYPFGNNRSYIFYGNAPLTVSPGNNTVLTDGTHAMANALVGRYSNSYETEPRRFWIYGYDKAQTDLNLLLKTGIIWSSGEHYFVGSKPIPGKRIVATHYYTGLRGNDIPFIVKLYTWGY